MRFSSRRTVTVDEDNPYWMSFSDLMSGLLVIFILAALALILELTQTRQQVDEALEELRTAEQVRRNILDDIVDELKRQDIHIEVNENKSILRIPDSLAFASGRYEIPDDQNTQDTVNKIGLAIHGAILKQRSGSVDCTTAEVSVQQEHDCKPGYEYLDTVFIEGHTDSMNFNGLLGTGNWGLSAFRAISLWSHWNQELELAPAYQEMINHDGQKLFSVSGYADSRRVNEVEDTAQQKAQNRRIDIRFTIRRPSDLDLENVLELAR
ncbi:Flagellar motor protein MotB [Ferrimonas sediminum]|uniref:Flagellar motor protein MotB n=1 Tax=Ferrimonas sediminum TaxID=718193 RepID=A0A1G8UYZ6_9GAMM|nr:OmpA family protein [Ferrimonas sediminum]SDJ58170.1 Flagellar motor protein MotB [Ferrimonas sediminum]